MSDTIRIEGIRAEGRHGVFAEEKAEAQPFVVDVEVDVDVAPAAARDAVEWTVSYADVAADVLAVIEGPSVDLVETLADRIAARVLSRGAPSVRVTVHKPEAPVGVRFSDVSVTVRRDGPLAASGTIRRAILALGSNLGDRRATLDRAVGEIGRLDVCVGAISAYVETEPVLAAGQAPQPNYLNAVLSLTTAMSPLALLDALRRIEVRLGRVRRERWGARTIDIDIVDVEGVVGRSPGLSLPHPRAAERLFVLGPWACIEPDAELGGVPVASLVDALREGGRACG